MNFFLQLITLSQTVPSKDCTAASRTRSAHAPLRQQGPRSYPLYSLDSEHRRGKTLVFPQLRQFSVHKLSCQTNFCKIMNFQCHQIFRFDSCHCKLVLDEAEPNVRFLLIVGTKLNLSSCCCSDRGGSNLHEPCLQGQKSLAMSKGLLGTHPRRVKLEDTLGQKCSRSRRRAAKADKRMVLVHTHGLFITTIQSIYFRFT